MNRFFGLVGMGIASVALAAGVVACNGGSASDGGGGSGSTSTGSTTGSGGSGGAGGSGGTGGSGAVAVTVSPHDGTVLTCTQSTFTAAVTGASDTSVTWTATPGTIDANGVYGAPIQVPSPPNATITATSNADPMSSDAATVTLATAVPGKPSSLNATPLGDDSTIYQHQVASRGDRVYAAWGTADQHLYLRRSDDGGKTWADPVEVATGLDDSAMCVGVAVDPVDPQVVYVSYRLPNTALYAAKSGAPSGNSALVLASSSDGGKTWTSRPLILGGYAGGPFGGEDQAGICADVVAPAKDAVVVESPGEWAGDGNPDMFLFADGARGAGFANGSAGGGDYIANGETGALHDAARNLGLSVAQDGGSVDVTESPRLFADGKGKVCLTWLGYGDNGGSGVYVQCSTDLGKTFTVANAIVSGAPAVHLPTGAFAPNGDAYVLWFVESDPSTSLLLAKSTDGAKTFDAPIAVPVYEAAPDSGFVAEDADVAVDASGVVWVAYDLYDGDFDFRIAVDKSCDGGTTWSGSVLANGPEGMIAAAMRPGLFLTTAGPGLSSETDLGGLSPSLQVQSLVP